MRTVNLTAEEYKTLLTPTPVEEWGDQQRVAREVQGQIRILTDKRVTIDDFDIAAINKAIEVNHEGCFIAQGKDRTGGWNISSWEVSVIGLQRAMRVTA